jgi:predicted esterase
VTLHLVERDSAGPTQRILVLLPGYGDEPATFVDHLDTIDRDRRWHVAVARPPLATPDGPAWFTVGEEGPDADQLTDAVDAVAATLADLLDRFALAPDALVVGGFSQGGAMALAAGLDPSLAARPGAVAALGAYLPHRGTSQDQALFAGRPVLVAHGADDEVVDALLGRSAAKTLHRTGAIVTWVEVDAGHTLDGPLLGALRDWLVELAAGRAPSAPPA